MTAYTDSLGFNKGTADAYLASGADHLTVMSVELDFADIIAARSAAGVSALTTSDTLQVLRIPAGSVVLSAGFTVTSVESTNTTGTIGLADGSVTYATGIAINATGTSAANLANPTVYSAADTLDISFATAMPTDLVVKAWVVMADVS
jgi:hypothetical protein